MLSEFKASVAVATSSIPSGFFNYNFVINAVICLSLIALGVTIGVNLSPTAAVSASETVEKIFLDANGYTWRSQITDSAVELAVKLGDKFIPVTDFIHLSQVNLLLEIQKSPEMLVIHLNRLHELLQAAGYF